MEWYEFWMKEWHKNDITTSEWAWNDGITLEWWNNNEMRWEWGNDIKMSFEWWNDIRMMNWRQNELRMIEWHGNEIGMMEQHKCWFWMKERQQIEFKKVELEWALKGNWGSNKTEMMLNDVKMRNGISRNLIPLPLYLATHLSNWMSVKWWNMV